MPIDPILDPSSLARELSGRHLINGELVASQSGKNFDVLNPATGKVIGQAADGDAQDVAIAVGVAKKAQKDWAERPARERGKLVAECGRVLMSHTEELGRLIALESGKALRTESRVEASVLADMFVFFGGLASELKGETVPFNPNMMTLTTREPVGVVGAIIPWNVPLLLMAIKVAPALVAGNAVVVKSAEDTPLAALRVCQIMQEILPKGVLNILSGFGPSCGGPLVEHKDVKKVSFTGSVETGRTVYKAAAEKLIPVTLELGGKSPMIVMDDADLDKAIAGAVGGMRFTRQGQSCTASSRILVHEKLHDAFVKQLIEKVNALKMGDPLDEETDIGTIINRKQFDKVRSYIDIGEKEGATKHELSALPTDSALADGTFVRPVIFTDVDPNARVAREEIFGPVACVFKFKTFEEALELANDSDFGLAATVWTTDLKTALTATKRLEAGFVQVNQNLVVQPNLSYGGIKLSGLGKEASLESMLEHFTYKKTIILNME
ncbi:aldehyde dehydrogenase family protein [Thalassospira sp. GB04J01]|uniref:aldehyde dehydrogenase family protein n=1 Tax=Thalassospira TaxID=168934 RepID=UPI000C0F1F71|nr:aldehyde dehydrogenase family protein [Thalassospira sp. GB04J01]MBV16911.1 aldehyde dehydrogenase [Thalassospira sp.]|tara:strand:- start:44868 stop:46355 length:1488 start_codon:yes stop_codon:yes gene_type:complete